MLNTIDDFVGFNGSIQNVYDNEKKSKQIIDDENGNIIIIVTFFKSRGCFIISYSFNNMGKF